MVDVEKLREALAGIQRYSVTLRGSPELLAAVDAATEYLTALGSPAEPDYECGWCFEHNAPMDNLSYCDNRNFFDPQDQCDRQQAWVVRAGRLLIDPGQEEE
jgi:hypothetical protein